MEDGETGFEEVLIVDDNPGDIRFIEEAFEASSFDPTIQTSTTKDDALTFLTRRMESEESLSPDLVLLDWNLSQTTGEEVLEAAKSADRQIAVIVITGSNPETSVVDSTIDRADLVIEKPTEPEEYMESVRSVLDNDTQTRSFG